MQKRHYIFLFLLFILLYLSFKIISFEYKKYTISSYIEEQKLVIKNIWDYIKNSKDTLKYINTFAFKNKVLKQEAWKKMKGEELIVLTSQKVYNKFSWKPVAKKEILFEDTSNNQAENISSMTNFEKWKYFLLKIK